MKQVSYTIFSNWTQNQHSFIKKIVKIVTIYKSSTSSSFIQFIQDCFIFVQNFFSTCLFFFQVLIFTLSQTLYHLSFFLKFYAYFSIPLPSSSIFLLLPKFSHLSIHHHHHPVRTFSPQSLTILLPSLRIILPSSS